MRGECWLQLVPDGRFRVKVARSTQRRPRWPEPGAAVLKLDLSLPDNLFAPLEATLDVEGRQTAAVVVSLADAGEQEDVEA